MMETSDGTKISLTPRYKVTLKCARNKHFYYVDDDEANMVEGVTGTIGIIDKPALRYWARNMALESVRATLTEAMAGNVKKRVTITSAWIEELLAKAKARPKDVLDHACDYGSRVHEWIDTSITTGEDPEIEPDLEISLKSFLKWRDENGIKIIAGDTKVFSKTYDFGGSLDALAIRGRDFIIIDFKTSKAIYKESMYTQLGAYSIAFLETFGSLPNVGMICRFSKANPEEFEVAEIGPGKMAEAREAFLACLDLKRKIYKVTGGKS